MKNFTIEAFRSDYIIVKADSKRFGDQEVMFEGNTFNQCFDYIKRETGKKELRLTSSLLCETITDRDGRTFPWIMQVYN